MKKIRKSVFETNSSSSHVLHIDEDTMLMDTSLVPNEDGEISVVGGEFSWEWEKLISAREKIEYCIADNQDLKMLERVIKDQTGATKVTLTPGGYIDHESVGTSREAFDNEQKLRNLIFNMNSVIFTGNDNGEPPLNFYCDESTANFKMALVPKKEYRDHGLDSIIEDKNVEFPINQWTYTLRDDDEAIYDAFYQYINYYISGFNRDIDNKIWPDYKLDIPNRTATLELRKDNKVIKSEIYILVIRKNIK